MEMFYGEPGGQMQGPLNWDAIRAAVHAGRLGKTIQISRDGQEPWVPFIRVENFGLAAFNPQTPKAHPTRAEVDARAKEIIVENATKSVGGFIKIVGHVFMIVAVLCILAVLVQMTSGGSVALPIYCALSTLVSGLLFFALAEVLDRLTEIVHLMKK